MTVLAVAAARFVKVELFSTLTGYTKESVYTKIKRGVWLEGKEYIRAPDENILVDLEGYYRWAAGQRQVA